MKIIVWCLCMLFSIHAFADGEEGAKVGDQSPDFEYEDKDGKIYSYCAPCKKEIPYLEKIQEKFKKKNIFFVSIAIDLNKKEWIQFLEQNPLKGTQLVFDRKWLSFVHYYQVTTIPRYILLDKEGKVVHLDMPRPSNPEFEKILKSLKGL